MRNYLNNFSITLICLFLYVGSLSLLYSQDNAFRDKKIRGKTNTKYSVEREFKYEDTESKRGAQFYNKAVKESRTPLIDELHNARLQNDNQKMREIESQYYRPSMNNGDTHEKATIKISGSIGHPGQIGQSDISNSNWPS